MRCILPVLLLLFVMLLAGCARYPSGNEGLPPVPAQTIYSELTVNGLINPQYYYFFALDTSGVSNKGPVPVTTGTGFGNGWGTLSNIDPNGPVQQPPFFVQIYNGTAQQFRVNPTTKIAESLGPPYRWGILAADRTPALVGPIISVEVDASLIVPTIPPVPPATTPTPGVLPSFVNANWINVLAIAQQPQDIGIQTQYDGFGTNGNQFFQVPLGVTNTWISGVGSVPPQPTNKTTNVADINIIGWRIEDRRNQ